MNIKEMNIIEDIQATDFEPILTRAVQVDVAAGRMDDPGTHWNFVKRNANKAWKRAGNPLDTENIRNILKNAAKLSDEAIDDALQSHESRSAKASGTAGIPKDTKFETASSEKGSKKSATYKWDGTKWTVERHGRWVDTDENNTTDPFIGKSDKRIYELYYRAVRLGKAVQPDGRPPPEPTAPVAEPKAPSALTADMEMQALAKILTDSNMIIWDPAKGIKVPNDALRDLLNKTRAFIGNEIQEQKTNMENEMRVNEMCGSECGAEMEMPKTNYNLSVTKDEGSTHKTMTVTSDQPDELIRVLQLSGMDTGHSEPDGDEIAGVDMDHDEPSSVSSMKDLISKVSHPPVGQDMHDEEVEEVEQDHRSDTKTFGLKDLVVGQTKKQPRQRRVAAHHGDNPYKDAGQLEEQYIAAYDEYKNEK
jgi:hypothetical protein